MIKLNRFLIVFPVLVLLFTACQPTKKVHQDRLYLQGIDTADVSALNIPEPIIQKGEKLSILVFSDNPEATALFNQVQSGSGSSGSSVSSSVTSGASSSGAGGYLVDLQGNILFHSLGPIHIEGLTKPQLIKLLQEKLDTVLKHPYVEVRFLNKRVTVLGEVAKPGVIDMPEERLSVLDAIALSGDVTNFGRKDNILVIREESGKRTAARINIKNASVYKSDYFYLHSNDLVYVEPDRKKPTGTDQTLLRNITLAATLISTFAIVYSIFRR